MLIYFFLSKAPPRKRSNSLLHWMQKTLSNVKTSHASHSHDGSSRKPRSSSTSHETKHSSKIKSLPNSYTNKYGRPRAPTMDSIASTHKKGPRIVKTLSDTDERAQPSVPQFQFVFGR